jgi:tetratricopeptide (TPR) repeat protein
MHSVKKKNPVTVPLCRALAALALLTVSSFAYQVQPHFWAAEIDSALNVRDRCFKTLFNDTLNFRLGDLNRIQQDELCTRLLDNPDPSSQWHYFFLGILECERKTSDSSAHFSAAMTLAQQDPGSIWALFIEFTRNRKTLWAERCLLRLEKLLLASGAQSAPAIAQQLLFYAYLSEKQKNIKSAFNYYSWAERFDRNQPWSLLHRMLNCLPSHPQLFSSTFQQLIKLARYSWVLQLHGVAHVYTWLHFFIIFFVLAIFSGLGLRYLPQAVHPIADRLPEDTPTPLKTFLPACFVLSFISFGIIPFLWLILFLTWRFAVNKEKVVFSFALLILFCAPFDARIREMFRQALMPQGSVTLYARASEEGYSPSLHQRALEKIVIDRSDVCAFMTASLFALKKGDTAAASLSARSALALRPNDPVLLLLAGNVSYAANDLKTAASLYQKILSRNPSQMDARFNLAQCYARKSDTTIDLDFMKMLSSKDQNTVNTFINTNQTYFSSNWPILRQFFPPSHSASYFWETIFPAYNGSWNTAKNLWGSSFFGLSPRLSLVIFTILLLLFVLWNIFLVLTKRANPGMTCRLCKCAICDGCKKGELCLACFHATKSIRNVKMLATIQTSIIQKRQSYYRLTECFLDICLPGSGMLFSKRHSLAFAFFIVAVTGIVYASYFFLLNIHSGYPLWLVYDKLEQVPYFLMAYNLIFIIRALFAAFRKKERAIV